MLVREGEPSPEVDEQFLADLARLLRADGERSAGVRMPLEASEQVVVDGPGRLVGRTRVPGGAGVAEFDDGECWLELAGSGDDVRHDVGQTVGVLEDDERRTVFVFVASAVAYDCVEDDRDVVSFDAADRILGDHRGVVPKDSDGSPEHFSGHLLVIVSEEAIDRVQVSRQPGHLGETVVVAGDEQAVACDEHVVVRAVSAVAEPLLDELGMHLVETTVEHVVLLSQGFLCQCHLLAPCQNLGTNLSVDNIST